MKKLIFVLPVLLTLPSYADIASNAESANCDSTTIGATEGSTDLEAQWSANQYSENPGYYLLFDNNTVSTNQTCTAGNYCPGFTNQTFNDASMGLNSCATNDANFPNSDAGASAATQCYRACNIDNMGTESGKTIAPIAHATAISGNDYYGAGVDTCVPTACESGYHVGVGAGPLANYVETGGSDLAVIALNGNSTYSNLDEPELNNGEWRIEWEDGTQIFGTSACTTTPKTSDNIPVFPSNTFTAGDYGNNEDSGKKYCYCRMNKYSVAGGTIQNVSSTPWVYINHYGVSNSVSNCADMCTRICGYFINVASSPYRASVFGDLGVNEDAGSCIANKINITWDKKNGEANVSNQCTYGGAVTIPEQPTKAGYTFGGWKIKTTTPAE